MRGRIGSVALVVARAAGGLFAMLALGGEAGLPVWVPAEDALATGDVDATSVVVWARTKRRGTVTIEVAAQAGTGPAVARRELAGVDVDRPGKTDVAGLAPGTRHVVRGRFPSGAVLEARFRTASPPAVRAGLRFGASGDWSGDMAPHPSIRNVPARDLDFFVALGDTVYADIPSPAVPLRAARTLREFRAKHAEAYSARHGLDTFAALRASTATFATIDDHDLSNNFAGAEPQSGWVLGSRALVNDTPEFDACVRAFHEWNPIRFETWTNTGDPDVEGEADLYRFRRFGDDAALFVLDTRSFRSAPLERPERDAASIARFRAAALAPGRTLLGGPQLARLEADLLAAQAAGITWKFVLIPTPIQSVGTGAGPDRYEGYAFERARLLAFVRDRDVRNVVFVTADLHGMIVDDLVYRASATEGAPVGVDAFEVVALPVGCHGVLGMYGIRPEDLTDDEQRVRAGSDMDAKDDLLARSLDARLAAEGLGPTGLADSAIAARLVEGKWVRGHAFGWNEFEVDAATQHLTVTAWGVPHYASEDVERSLDLVPRVLSRFTVDARPPPVSDGG